MPHFKCVACKNRLYSAGGPADLASDLCPDCGALLEPVGELAEVTQARLDAERWVDDGGSFRAEAVPSSLTGDETRC